MIDRQVKSAAEIDFSGLICPMIVVYRSPRDYPGRYAARVFDMDKPTNAILVQKSLDELQRDIKEHTGKFFIPRSAEDDKVILGVWI